jgi:hemerythrin-like domain-containing protein
MTQALEALTVEHKRMSRLLGLLEEQVAVLEQAGEADYEVIKEILDYFLTYPDLCHHPKEDLVLEKLRARAPAAAAAVGALDEEHDRLSHQLHDFTHAVMNLMLEVEVPREALVRLAKGFVDHERRHMAAEERVFFPAALRYLTEADWREIGDRAKPFKDPLSASEAGLRFPELRRLMAL